MFAFLEAKKAGLLTANNFSKNIVAGVVVGIVAIPLAMAFAIASGAKPEQGLYTAIVSAICVSVFGGTRVQIAGPTGAFIVILSSVTAKYGIEGLQTATFMAGIMLVAMGLARLGSIIKYIPAPVIVGFTSGIGVVIWVGQWKDFFGLKVSTGSGHFHEKLKTLVMGFNSLDPYTTVMGFISLMIVIYVPRYVKKIPAPLVALLVGTVLQSIFKFSSVSTIGTAFGGIPQALPTFHLPDLSFTRILELIGPAFTIALLGAIESLLSAVVADGMLGTHHSSNQELIGQGIANIVCPLMGGFAATGAIARTAVNVRSGGNCPIAGIVHSCVLVLVILLFAPLAQNIPLATLAAILFIVAYNMSEAHRFLYLLKQSPRSDAAVLLATFFLTIFGDLVVAVNVGVILATLLFMRRMAKSVQVERHEEKMLLEETSLASLPSTVVVYSIDGPFFWGAVETFEHIASNVRTDVKVLVIRLKHVPFIDATGLLSLRKVIERFKNHGTKVLLCEANKSVHDKITRACVEDSFKNNTVDRSLLLALRQV